MRDRALKNIKKAEKKREEVKYFILFQYWNKEKNICLISLMALDSMLLCFPIELFIPSTAAVW